MVKRFKETAPTEDLLQKLDDAFENHGYAPAISGALFLTEASDKQNVLWQFRNRSERHLLGVLLNTVRQIDPGDAKTSVPKDIGAWRIYTQQEPTSNLPKLCVESLANNARTYIFTQTHQETQKGNLGFTIKTSSDFIYDLSARRRKGLGKLLESRYGLVIKGVRRQQIPSIQM